jgi:hypothetical protein
VLFPVCIIDDFLGPEAAATLLAFAQEQHARFTPSTISSNGVRDVLDPDFRASLSYNGDFGAVLAPFHARLGERMDQIAHETQTRRFDPVPRNLSLVAHCHGDRFRRHIDTAVGESRNMAERDRALSLVYYLHARPCAFTGGELVIHALAGEERRVIVPQHDRLVAFPSIAPHEIEPVDLPGNDFAGARFALVSWLHRLRG